MQQEDYLKRQIDQLGRVLGKILADLIGLKSQGRMEEGIEAASRAFKAGLNIDPDQLADIPVADVVGTLQQVKELNGENLDMLAEILFTMAELHGLQGNKKRRKLLERSLAIYEHLDQTSSTYTFDRHSRIGKINNELHPGREGT